MTFSMSAAKTAWPLCSTCILTSFGFKRVAAFKSINSKSKSPPSSEDVVFRNIFGVRTRGTANTEFTVADFSNRVAAYSFLCCKRPRYALPSGYHPCMVFCNASLNVPSPYGDVTGCVMVFLHNSGAGYLHLIARSLLNCDLLTLSKVGFVFDTLYMVF